MKITLCLLFLACLAFAGCQQKSDTTPAPTTPAATNAAPAK